MTPEQLRDAVNKIDDNLISEAEFYEPDDTVSRRSSFIMFFSAACTVCAAFCICANLFTNFRNHKNPDPEINNSVTKVTTSNDITSETTVTETAVSHSSKNSAAVIYTTEISSSKAISSDTSVTSSSAEKITVSSVTESESAFIQEENIVTDITKTEIPPVSSVTDLSETYTDTTISETIPAVSDTITVSDTTAISSTITTVTSDTTVTETTVPHDNFSEKYFFRNRTYYLKKIYDFKPDDVTEKIADITYTLYGETELEIFMMKNQREEDMIFIKNKDLYGLYTSDKYMEENTDNN